MKEGKEFLRQKFIQFQTRIAELNHLLTEERNSFHEKEKGLYLSLLDILDAFENIDETIEAKKDRFDKSAHMLSKNVRSVHRKLVRLIRSADIVQMEFSDNKALMDHCKIVDTRAEPDLENQVIITVVKNGYINRKDGTVLRKAEVVTVLNED